MTIAGTEAPADSEFDREAEPPTIDAPLGHPKLPAITTALRSVFDPEIPVNIYELGLIYKISIDADSNVGVQMTLTAPGCPVAGEMPEQVRAAVAAVEGLGDVDIELVWEPSWHPGLMAETAKLQLGMF
jgi:FeS assembly SUF system protein